MKNLILLMFLFPIPVLAQTWMVNSGNSQYEVKHLVKKVHSESKDIKGKMNCTVTECEFLVAAPVKSFTSSDSNRDSNMMETTEASKFPVTSAKGKFPAENLKIVGKWSVPVEIEFHGIKQGYTVVIEHIKDMTFKAEFILKLDQHKIDRPSLFGIKIEDEVPMTFNLSWKLSGP